MDNSLFNDPLAMAGLAVMGGKDLGSALTEAAQLKQQSDYRNMQMSLMQAQAQQAMMQARLQQNLLGAYGGGPADAVTGVPMQQGMGEVMQEAPQDYTSTQAYKEAQRKIVLGEAAGLSGLAKEGEMEIQRLQELDKRRYESEKESPERLAKKKMAEESGKQRAEKEALLASMESKMPNLESVATKLSALGKDATYTYAGRTYDTAKRELGLDPSKGAIARAEYISTVDNEILPLLRDTFGAQFTQQEGESLKATLGDPNKSPAEKDAVLRSFIQTKKSSISGLKKELGKEAAPKAEGMPEGAKLAPDGNYYVEQNGKFYRVDK